MAKDSVNKAGVGKNDSIGRTLMVVVVLCLVCSVIVAGAAVGLKPMQEEQKQLDKQRNILAVAGLMQGDKLDGEQVKTLFGQRIEPRLLDLKTGEFTSGNPYTFDMSKALKIRRPAWCWMPRRIRRALNAAATWLKCIW